MRLRNNCTCCKKLSLVLQGRQGRESPRHGLAILLTGAALVAVATIGHGFNAPAGEETASSGVTVIYKNQMHPSIGELEAGAAEKYDSGQANSVKEVIFQRRGQWI